MAPVQTVDQYLEGLDADKRAQVVRLRAVILGCQPLLHEHIKWNSPSYVWQGDDRITFNLQNKEGLVKLVLHQGATRPENKKGAPVLNDTSGLVQWQSDIRGLVSFTSEADIVAKQVALEGLLVRWLSLP